MDFKTACPEYYEAVQAMIPLIEGRPCVHVDKTTGAVCVSRKMSGVHIDTESVYGMNDWVEPEECRPGELTDEFVISYACLEIGSYGWYDNYFQWYFVFHPEMVARSMAGDHSWVWRFLRLRPPPQA